MVGVRLINPRSYTTSGSLAVTRNGVMLLTEPMRFAPPNAYVGEVRFTDKRLVGVLIGTMTLTYGPFTDIATATALLKRAKKLKCSKGYVARQGKCVKKG